MTIGETSAAREMENCGAEINSHKVISLLMEGALERISQARSAINSGNDEQAKQLIGKIIAIINGLRDSLNLNDGGEIALNLENLYQYILERIDQEADSEKTRAIEEAEHLITEIKLGWDAIAPEGVPLAS